MYLAGAEEANPSAWGMPEWLAPVLVMAALVLLGFLAMRRGWRRRATRHQLPPLVPAPPLDEAAEQALLAHGRYFGTTVAGDWLDRVVDQGLGLRSSVTLSLSPAGVDVYRVDDPFRIPASTLRGARHDQGIAGKVIPPNGVLVVTWQHGETVLDSGFRLDAEGRGPAPGHPEPRGRRRTHRNPVELHNEWIRSVDDVVKRNREQWA